MKIYTYIFLVVICFFLHSCDKKKQYVREGNSAYNKQSYNEAEEKYTQAILKDSNFAPALYNLGNTYYKSADSNYKAAAEMYSKLIYLPIGKNKKDTLNYANTLYNRGNAFFYLSRTNTEDSNSINYLQQATKDYQQSLLYNSEDSNAKYNLALCLWLLKNDNRDDNEQREKQMQQVLESMRIKEKQVLERARLNRDDSQSSSDEKDW